MSFILRMSSKSYDELQPHDPLKDNAEDNSFIIEYNGSDSNSKSIEEDHVEYTEEVYLDIDSGGDHIDEAEEPDDRDNSVASPAKLDELFHCSACDVDFQSVEKHIRQFHGGHEVLVDVGNVIIWYSLYRNHHNTYWYCSQGQQEYQIEDSDEAVIKMEPDENSEDSNDPLVAPIKWIQSTFLQMISLML